MQLQKATLRPDEAAFTSETLQVSGELSGDGRVLVNGEPVESVEGSSTSFTDSVDASGADSVTLEIQTELGEGIALDGWDVTAFSSGDVSVGPLPGNRVTTDLCHAAEGKQSFECPDSAVDAFTYTVEQETLHELQFEFAGTATVKSAAPLRASSEPKTNRVRLTPPTTRTTPRSPTATPDCR